MPVKEKCHTSMFSFMGDSRIPHLILCNIVGRLIKREIEVPHVNAYKLQAL